MLMGSSDTFLNPSLAEEHRSVKDAADTLHCTEAYWRLGAKPVTPEVAATETWLYGRAARYYRSIKSPTRGVALARCGHHGSGLEPWHTHRAHLHWPSYGFTPKDNRHSPGPGLYVALDRSGPKHRSRAIDDHGSCSRDVLQEE